MLLRRGEALLLILLGIPTGAVDWQIANTWALPVSVRLLCLAATVVALGTVIAIRRLAAVGAALAVSLLYALPILGGIVRWHLVPSGTALIGDGAYQMQLSRDVLMRGADPYGFNYDGTGMERAPWGQPFPNPALHHLDYWPGTVVLPLPLQAAFHAVLGWWDERLWLLIAAAAVWVLLGRLAPGPAGRMAAIVFFLIPGHSLLAVLGDNDLPMVALLLGATLAIGRRRWMIAGVLVGLAIATKQTALIAVPVLAAYAIAQGVDRRAFLKAAGLAGGAVAVLFAPFLIWNAHAFVTDTILFNFGGGSETYPIQGMGLSAVLLNAGIIRGSRDAFPFLLIQLPLVIVAWLLAWRWLRQHRLLGDAVLFMGIALVAFLFANRFAQPTYLLMGVDLIVAGLVLRTRPTVAAPNRELSTAAA
ncbi:MAG: DUF2029 domain-containing protein [Chloroflexi bacterium]|nr:MAG: DUF2029 domain-containing protein [Chloroflexota bacterium]